MKSAAILRMFRRLSGIAILGAAFAAGAAQLDVIADAVLGKATFSETAVTEPPSASNFRLPGAVAEDPVTGALWVVDLLFNRVLRFTSAAAFANGEAANLVLGQPDFTSTNAGLTDPSARSLFGPFGVAVDQAGRVYVADTNNHRVLVFRPPFSNGMAASDVIGQANFTSGSANRSGFVAANTLNGPSGLAVDRTGNLYVSDPGNHRVLKFNAPAITGATAAKVFGQAGFTVNVPATTAAGLRSPGAVAIDGAAALWVTDQQNNRVLRYDLGASSGDTTADLVLCQALFTTSTVGATASTCTSPTGVAVDLEGVVHVAEFSNSRILQFTALSNGAAATAVIGQVIFTAGACNQDLAAPTAATLCRPAAAIIDRTGHLLVADGYNGRVLRYDLPRARVAPTLASLSPERVPRGSGNFTLTVNGNGFYQGSVVNWNGSPRSTAFITDKRILAQILPADVAGAGPFAVTVTNPAPGGGTSTSVSFATYVRASLDATADRVLGQPDFTGPVSLNPQVGEEQLGAVNAATLGSNALIHLAVDRVSGRLFVADSFVNSRILSWPSASSFYNAQPADLILGQRDEFSRGCNAGGLSASSLCNPYGVAVDPAGALYVSDTANNRVLRYAPPFSTGMAATRVFGQGGSFTTGTLNAGGISANGLNEPRSVAVNGASLFVHDNGNLRILVYNDPTANTTADAAIGQPNMNSALNQPASATSFGQGDSGLALDASGRLHFAGQAGNRVLRFPPPFTSGMAADLVLGQPGFATTAAATTASGLSYPAGIAFDPGGNLLVAEFDNNRIVRYEAPLTSGMAATGLLNQANFVTIEAIVVPSATRLARPVGLAVDAVGNVFVVGFSFGRILAFDRPFAFALDPATDLDSDGIPNAVETTEGRDPYTKDNDVFPAGAPGPRLFAMQQYRDFLSREGDAAGISGWTSLITAGTYSRLQVIDAFLSSDEFSGFVAPVVRLYFATFLRVPDYAGLTFNAGLVRAGTVTLTQLADYFVASPEFALTYGALDNAAFVTLLYNNVLGRAPDPAGLAGWVSLLSGGYSRGQVLLGFSDSVEYRAAMANKVFVTMMYAGMLRRTPEPSGFNGWVDFLAAGTYTREQVINGFFLSTEYRARFLP